MSHTDHDVIVIGGGSGGYAAAHTTATAGSRTAVIESAEEIGGLCILRGCMPTKAMLYAAEVYQLSKEAATWGINNPNPGFDFTKLMARKDQLIRDFADFRRQQLTDGRFEFIRGRAQFLDPHTIRLDNGQTHRAEHFLISTGSTVAASPLPDLDRVGYLTSDDVMNLRRLPRSLIVLGAGAVGIELAQFFSRLDVDVTLLQRSPRILKQVDPDAAEAITSALQREGMKVLTGTRITAARTTEAGKEIEFEHEGESKTVTAEEILFALGRTPNTAALGLENAGVDTDARGRIEANDLQQTTAPHIYAAGDCTGPHEIVHIAVQQAEIAAHNILRPGPPRKMDYRLLTSVVFTDPQVACVGLTEASARQQGIEILTASHPFNDHGKSMIMNIREGFVKLIAAPDSGEILGGCCVGPVGGELIHEIIAAVHRRMTAHELAEMPHYHPTLAEIWTYPAEEIAGQIDAGN